MKRNVARKNAFIICFSKQFNSEPLDFLLDYAKEHLDMEFDKMSLNLIHKLIDNKESLDDVIAKYLKKWSIKRIHKVCLTILEMALVEIMYFDNIPYKVTANEYVELSKEFAYSDDVSFVNGVIGSIIADFTNKDESSKNVVKK